MRAAVRVLLVLTIVIILGGCGSVGETEEKLDPVPMLEQMFPGQSFRAVEQGFRDQEGRTYLVEQTVKGAFTTQRASEMLFVVRRPAAELVHTQGFYNAYAAVFDTEGKRLVSEVLALTADEGNIAILAGEGVSYLFFAGSVTFQGWTEWQGQGGIYRAGSPWVRIWPEDRNFWQDRAVELAGDELKVLERRITPSPEKLIPDYTFEYAYSLFWDKKKAAFTPSP